MDYTEVIIKENSDILNDKFKVGAFKIIYKEHYGDSFILYLNDGLLHNKNSPAVVQWNPNIITKMEYYFHNGFLHKTNSKMNCTGMPPGIHVKSDDIIYNKPIFTKNKINIAPVYMKRIIHNENGPARIITRIETEIETGIIYTKKEEYYYLNNEKLSFKEWQEQIQTKLYW